MNAVALLEEVRARKRLPAPQIAKAIRIEAGISRERMAAELGVHPLTLGRWEEGLFKPRGPAAIAYLELLEALERVITPSE